MIDEVPFFSSVLTFVDSAIETTNNSDKGLAIFFLRKVVMSLFNYFFRGQIEVFISKMSRLMIF